MEFSIGFCSLTLSSVEDQKPYTTTAAERCALFDIPVSNSKKAVFFTTVNIIVVGLQQAPYLISLQVTTSRCKLPTYKFY
jgi:hypothetical protein